MGTGMDAALAGQLARRFGIHVSDVEVLDVPVNDVARVESVEGRFALKLYHPGRTREQVAWEVDLLRHLGRRGAPVAQAVRGPEGYVVVSNEQERPRCGVLWAWAEGDKPAPSTSTYERLGRAAALIHTASDGFPPSPRRESYDLRLLVDEQLSRMRSFLVEARCWDRCVALGERLKNRLRDPGLDHGLCHLDLSLDNVLEQDGRLTVIDFDSAGPSWRAIEAWGVLRHSAASLRAWLTGYRSVRTFSEADEAAVSVFAVVGDLRVVTWKLGVADSSREPLLRSADLPEVVAGWLEWERCHLAG